MREKFTKFVIENVKKAETKGNRVVIRIKDINGEIKYFPLNEKGLNRLLELVRVGNKYKKEEDMNSSESALFEAYQKINEMDGKKIVKNRYILDDDMYFTNLTIEKSGILITNGYKIFVSEKLINKGIICNNGEDGANYATKGSNVGTLPGGQDGVCNKELRLSVEAKNTYGFFRGGSSMSIKKLKGWKSYLNYLIENNNLRFLTTFLKIF